VTHVHRIGRTGRLGRPGLVVSFVSEEDEHAFAALERRAGHELVLEPAPRAAPQTTKPPQPSRRTLLLAAGKNKKLRRGDLLGALTGEGGIAGSDVGSIQIDENTTYVAVTASCAERALARLSAAGVKGKSVKARLAGLSLREDT
jgi:ATP-independent RNA helicase DbpA